MKVSSVYLGPTILRSCHCGCSPSLGDNIVPVFCESKIQERLVSIHDSNGKKIKEVVSRTPFRSPISKDVLEHSGESCDMYTLENLERAGVTLTTITTPFYRPSLADSSQTLDYLENFDTNQLIEKSQPQSE